jgi:hypothetical protein
MEERATGLHTVAYNMPPRETREGWPLVTVENNIERGLSLVGLLGSWCWYRRCFSALAAIVCTVQNTIFLTAHVLL